MVRMMVTKSPKSKFAVQFSCYIVGAAMGAAIGSQIDYLSDAIPADLRYGASGLGGFIGWAVTPLLFGLATASGVSMVRPPPPFADEEAQQSYQDNVIGCGLALLVLGAIVNFGLLVYSLLEKDWKKGLPVLLLVTVSGVVLSAFGSVRRKT